MVQRMAGRADLCLDISCHDHGCRAQRAPGQASWVGLGLGLGLGLELGCELGLGLASGSGSGIGLGLGLGLEGAHRSRRGSALEAMVAPWLGLGLRLTVRVRAYG